MSRVDAEAFLKRDVAFAKILAYLYVLEKYWRKLFTLLKLAPQAFSLNSETRTVINLFIFRRFLRAEY
jgi:hypothetical protein